MKYINIRLKKPKTIRLRVAPAMAMKPRILLPGLMALVFLFAFPAGSRAEWLIYHGFAGDSDAAEIANPNLTAGNFVLSPSLVDEGFSSGERRAAGWPLGNPINTNVYWGFGYTIANGYTVSLTSLTFQQEGKNSSPSNWFLRYNGDNFSSDLATGSIIKGLKTETVDLSAYANLTGSHEYRFYASGGSVRWAISAITLNGSIAPAPPTVPGIIYDPFSDGSLTNAAAPLDPKDVNWYTDDALMTKQIAGLNGSAALRFSHPSEEGVIGAPMGNTYLLNTVGRSYTLSFDFKLPSPGIDKAEGFRFGLFNDQGAPLTGDGTHNSIGFKGYSARIATGTSSELGIDREDGGDKSMLDGGDRFELNVDSDYNIDESTLHTAKLVLTRMSGGVQVQVYIDNVLQLTGLNTDQTKQYLDFNTIGFAIDTQSILIDNVKLTGTLDGPTPEVIFFGTGYVPGVSANSTQITDDALAQAGSYDLAVKWTDPEGIFLTNSAPHPSTNTDPAEGRVVPHFQLMAVDGAVTGVVTSATRFDQFVGANGSTIVTTWISGVTLSTNDFCGKTLKFLLTAEDEGFGGETDPDPQGDGDPIPNDRALKTSLVDSLVVYDDDTTGPEVRDLVLMDPFTDNGWSNGADPFDSAWYTDTADATLSISPISLDGLVNSDGLRIDSPPSFGSLGSYIGTDLVLQNPNDKIRLSFTFEIPGIAPNKAEGFRFGLFDDLGFHMTSNGVQHSKEFVGYGVKMATGSDADLKINREDGGSGTFLGEGDRSDLNNNTDFNIDESVAHTAEFVLSKLTNGVQVDLYIDGVLEVSGQNTDADKLYTNFNTIAFGIEDQDVIIEDVKLVYDIPSVFAWTNGLHHITWNTGAVFEASGVSSYYVTTNGTYPTNPTDGTAVGQTNEAYVAITQELGLFTNYLFAVDGDDDCPADGAMGPAQRIVTRYDNIAPLSPTFVTMTQGANNRSLDLTWTKPPDAGENGSEILSPWATYRVYYRVDGGNPTLNDPYFSAGDYPSLNDRNTQAVGLDGLALGGTYRVALAGVDAAGNAGPLSNVRDFTLPRSLDVAVSMTVDQPTPTEGDAITFTLIASNAGPDHAVGMVVADSLPAGLTYVSDSSPDYNTGNWTLADLIPGSFTTLTVVASVDAGAACQSITNVVSITALDGTDTDPLNNTDAADVNVQCLNIIVATAFDNGSPQEGDPIMISVTVSNTGPTAATGLTVSDDLPTGLSYVSDSSPDFNAGVWNIGTLAAETATNLTISATVDAGTACQTLVNTAQVSAITQTDINPADDSASAALTVQCADIVILKTVSDGAPLQGAGIQYTVIASNAGPNAAAGLTVSDTLPSGVTYVSDSSPDYAGGVWTIGALAPGSATGLTINVTVDAVASCTVITNFASVAALASIDPNGANNGDSAIISVGCGTVDVSIQADVDKPAPNEGETVIFTVVASNAGPETATGLTVSDNLPSGLTYVSDSSPDYNAGTWTIGALAPGASTGVTITATVDAGTACQTLVNTAGITLVTEGDSNAANDSDSASLTVKCADIALQVGVDNPTPSENDTIQITVIASNAGPETATGLVVGDALPAGLSYVSDSSPDYAGSTWTIGTLSAGASTSLTITATADAVGSCSAVTNTASVTAMVEKDPQPANDAGSVTVSLGCNVDVSLQKQVSLSVIALNEVVVYSIITSNAGPGDASGLRVTEPLPAWMNFVGSDSSDYSEGSGHWTIGDLAAGAVTNLSISVKLIGSGPPCQVITNTAYVSGLVELDVNSANDAASAEITRVSDTIDFVSVGLNGASLDFTVSSACTGVFFDVLCVDADEFSESLTNQWNLLQSMNGGSLSDTGQVTGIQPMQLGQGANKDMRFYRLAYQNRWQSGAPNRLVSEVVYFAMPITLYPGQNWIALPGIPDVATPAGVFGHSLPAGTLLPSSTTISWLSAEAKGSVITTNQIFLQDQGGTDAWMTSPLMGPVSPADGMPLDIRDSMLIQIPTNLPAQKFLFVGRVRTDAGTSVIAGNPASTEAYITLLGGLNQPVAAHPSDLNLGEAGPADNLTGFQGGHMPRLRGPLAVDLLWKFDAAGQAVPTGEFIWFRTTDNTWRFLNSGYPPVPDNYFKPGEAFVVKRAYRPGNGGYIRPALLQYAPPTRTLSP